MTELLLKTVITGTTMAAGAFGRVRSWLEKAWPGSDVGTALEEVVISGCASGSADPTDSGDTEIGAGEPSPEVLDEELFICEDCSPYRLLYGIQGLQDHESFVDHCVINPVWLTYNAFSLRLHNIANDPILKK